MAGGCPFGVGPLRVRIERVLGYTSRILGLSKVGCPNFIGVVGCDRPSLHFHTLDVGGIGRGSLMVGLDAQVPNDDVL